MSPIEIVQDDELIFRHIPGGTTWQAPGPRITSKNFELRTDRRETGVSVSRASITSAESLISRIGNRETGSTAASCSVAEIRSLGLDVISTPLDDDPGHAEIISKQASLDSQTVRRHLASLFRFHVFKTDESTSSSQS